MLPVVNRLLHDLMVGGTAVLACEQIAAKPQAIDNKERCHHNRHGGQAAGDTLLYACEASPIAFRLQNHAGTDAVAIVGAAIMGAGILLESAARSRSQSR